MKTFKKYFTRRMIVIALLGISSGFPLALCIGTLTVWLTKEGITKQSIGLFGALTFPYAIKFLWSPFFDAVRLPFLAKYLGKRRAWLVVTQLLLGLSVIGLGATTPHVNLYATAVMALVVAFLSASQDINVDAYRVEYLTPDEYGAGSAVAVFAYNVSYNLLVGAGALYIAGAGVNWHVVYYIMSLLVIAGLIGVLLGERPESESEPEINEHYFKHYVIDPFSMFMQKGGWLAFLLIAILYKVPDAALGALANNFYIEVGFTLPEIATVIKIFGFSATMLGAVLGGIIVTRYDIYRALLIGLAAQAFTVLFFSIQALRGHDIYFLIANIALENLGGGISGICLVVLISRLCNKQYTATQYALLSSLSSLGRTFLRAPSGYIAAATGWFWFFVICAALAIPCFVVIILAKKHIQNLDHSSLRGGKDDAAIS